ncbi:hypothetical protein K1719_013310 [Acacia pycnantha]|nr:hypothetical protein K1719_013310 [Acacia pycnantha]
MASFSSSSSSNPFLFSTLSLVCFIFFFFSEKKSFVSAIRSEETSNELQHNTHNRVSLSSLFPSSSCSSPTQGANRNGSLEVVHKHGPCSKLKQPSSSSSPSSFIIQHREILKQDEARVRAIQSKLSKTHQNHQQEEVETSKKGSDGTQLPAKSGIPLGEGNYYVTVGLGSPKEICLSSSTQAVTSPGLSCSQLVSATGIRPACSKATRACIYGVQYGDGSFSAGYFAKEKLTVSATDVFDNFFFGCGQNNQGLFRGIAGLLGLGRNVLSFVEQTAGKYHKMFSYCLPSSSSTVGYIAFGGGRGSSRNVKFTPLSSISRGSSFYGLDFAGITVAGVNLQISASVFSSGTIIDSGTVITRLPPAAYGPLRDAFRKNMSRYPKADPLSILDTCYNLKGYEEVDIPTISLSFGGGVTVELDVTGIFFVASEEKVCLAFAANEDDGDVAIIGNQQQKTLEVVYDVAGEKIGFRPRACK